MAGCVILWSHVQAHVGALHHLHVEFLDPDSAQHPASRSPGQDNGFGVSGCAELDTQPPPHPSIKTHLELRWNSCQKRKNSLNEWRPETICTRETQEISGRVKSLTTNRRKCGLDVFGRCQWKGGGGVRVFWPTIGKLNKRQHQSEAIDTDKAGSEKNSRQISTKNFIELVFFKLFLKTS